MTRRRVQFRWRGRVLHAIGEGMTETIIVRSIERRLGSLSSGVQLLQGPGKSEYIAKYFDGTVYREDDVTVVE